MQRKTVIFIADSLDNAHKFQQVLSKLDVDVAAGSSVQFKKLLAAHPARDLVIYEARGDGLAAVSQVEAALAEDGSSAMLVIVNEEQLAEFRLPVSCKADFVVHGASSAECATRIRQLLWPGNENSSGDFIAIDNMTINLATYQVKVGADPVDLTYLEYALLRRVWGFDYYGGSRTVDVHVRRVRAKLGPELAQRLETVRGVGYLWNA